MNILRTISYALSENHELITPELVAAAFRGTSGKKSPDPGGIGPLAIRCLCEWEQYRIITLIRMHIRLGVHPNQWKTVREVTIPKPGKDDYSVAKAYWAISLLN